MSSDYLAAKKDDPLVHTSLIADFASGLIKGAIYAAVGIAAVAAIGLTGGTALAVGVAVGVATGFVLGDAIDAIADGFGKGVDCVLDLFELKGPPDAKITTGSASVHTKGLPAARAAGKVPAEVIYAELEAEAKDPPDGKALSIAKGILEKGWLLTPVGMGMAAGNFISGLFAENKAEPSAENGPPIIPSPEQGFWEGVLSPVVAPKNPYAAPAPEDTIECHKWHMFSDSGLYLAEGSKKVQINSQPACRNGDRSTCEAVITHEQSAPYVRIGGTGVVVRDIKSGKNPYASMAGEILGGLAVGLAAAGRKCLSEVGCMLASEIIGTGLGTVVGGMIGRATSTGHPVHAATGAKVLSGPEDRDFTLEGHIPLVWQRIYNSRNPQSGRLGRGWTLPFDVSLRIEDSLTHPGEDECIYTDMSGRDLKLGALAPGQDVYYIDEGFRVYRSLQNIFLLETKDGEYQLFEADPLTRNRLRLSQTLDRHDNALFYRYNLDGLLTHIHDELNEVFAQLHYSPAGQLCFVTQHNNEEHERRLVEYIYNDHGQLTAVRDADGRITRRFAWDADNSLMVMHEYATGLQAHYRWNRYENNGEAEWRVTEHWLQEHDRERLEEYFFDYDLSERTLQVKQSGVGVTFRRWNSQHQITEFIDEMNGKWLFEWNDARQLLSATDPQQGIYRFLYDERGNLSCERDPAGQQIITEWDKDFAFPLSRELPDGAVWRWVYNEKGDVVKLIDPELHITRFAWDEQGNCTGQSDALGNEYRYYWNGRGQLIRQADCSGYVTRLDYDEWGRPDSVTDAAGGVTAWHFSDADLLLSQTLADGRVYRFEYDGAGQLKSRESPSGEIIRLQRNRRGQVTGRINAAGDAVRFEYDRLGRLKMLLNEKSEACRFDYDSLHRLTSEYSLTGQRKDYHYNSLGQIMKVVSHPVDTGRGPLPPPQEIRFERDAIGRLTGRETEEYRTDFIRGKKNVQMKRSLLTEWRQAQQESRPPVYQDELEFKYDSHGQICEEVNHGGVYTWRRDALGNLVETGYPAGSRLRYLHYGSGHLQQVNLEQGEERHVLAEFERDRLHREILRSRGRLSCETTYDATGRITAQIARVGEISSVFAPVTDKRWFWDAGDNLTGRLTTYGKTTRPFEYGPGYREEYRYDLAGQVTARITDVGREEFSYDAASNRTEALSGAVLNDQVMSAGEYQYRYDGFGRLSERYNRRTGITQYLEYNSEQQLARVRFSGGEHSKAEYRYDILGRRTGKTVYKADNRDSTETTTFFWHGMQMCGEKREQSAQRLIYVYMPGSYEPLACVSTQETEKGSQSRVWYYHTHLNGLPEEVTDEEGDIVWRGEYGLWGNLKREEQSGTCPLKQNLRFQGQYFDAETGLHHNTFRYYAPECGRFTQQDPIGLRGGLNLYQYGLNPLVWVDPLGWCSTKLGKNMGARRGDGMGNHHLIPEELMKKEPFKSMFARLKKIGWDGDDASNGIFLPGSKELASQTGLPGHWSNHTDYTDAVESRLAQLAQMSPNLDDLQLALGVKRIQDWARESLENGVFSVNSDGRLM